MMPRAETQRRKEGIIIIVFLILSQGEKRVKKLEKKRALTFYPGIYKTPLTSYFAKR